jgi:hypothetical protein
LFCIVLFVLCGMGLVRCTQRGGSRPAQYVWYSCTLKNVATMIEGKYYFSPSFYVDGYYFRLQVNKPSLTLVLFVSPINDCVFVCCLVRWAKSSIGKSAFVHRGIEFEFVKVCALYVFVVPSPRWQCSCLSMLQEPDWYALDWSVCLFFRCTFVPLFV